MRSRNFVLWTLATLAIVAVLAGGCSKKTTNTVTQNASPEFTYMVAQVNQTMDSLRSLTDVTLDMTKASNTEVLNDLAFGPLPTDSTSTSNLWHIYVLTNSASGVTSRYIDSIQFLSNGSAQENPIGANQMQVTRNWSMGADDTTVSYKTASSRTTLTATNTSNPTAVVTGQFNLVSTDVNKAGAETVVKELTVNGDISSYNVPSANGWNNGCPTTGAINADVTLSIKTGSAAPVVTNWTLAITVTDGVATVSATQGAAHSAFDLNVCR